MQRSQVELLEPPDQCQVGDRIIAEGLGAEEIQPDKVCALSKLVPKPETRNPKPETRNPKPETRNPQVESVD